MSKVTAENKIREEKILGSCFDSLFLKEKEEEELLKNHKL